MPPMITFSVDVVCFDIFNIAGLERSHWRLVSLSGELCGLQDVAKSLKNAEKTLEDGEKTLENI